MPAPSNPPSSPAFADAFAEDQSLLIRWQEELAARREERSTLQARHRDRVEDALDHLDSLRKNARERQTEIAAAGHPPADTAAAPADANAPEPTAARANPGAAAPAPFAPAPFAPAELAAYRLPCLDLLRQGSAAEHELVPAEEVAANRHILQTTLDSFAVDAFVYDSIVGPRVTQFRVKPGFGVRVEAIASLEKNLALALSANAVRIQAPIPGESFVGIETPNRRAVPLALRSAFESAAWRDSTADLPIVLGVDITGGQVICDLAKAPHALIAGATGSGKSVCISNIILSLLYRFRPDELELVLIDPKIVEFAIYRDLPHLIHPVVTDPKQACQALKWLVREMEQRYETLAEKNVRNLAGFNARAAAEGFAKLPFIVLIIDELADLMMTAAQEIETPIARLAQMARAVGIHTILATQRPSVNVITGVIKANFPTRVAFQVASQIDSRTILDSKGAEALQGRGDMLYSPPGLGRLQRLQAPFVDDPEVEQIVASLKTQLQPRYRVELRPEDAPGGGEDILAGSETNSGLDPLIKEALEIISAHGRASTSYLQRRLRIGYNRAACLIEEMEKRRLIGPLVGNNPREIYVKPGDLHLD
jgi:S-DNA-T family DNA segregation ATPase FtsK/SpoIIIE